MVAEGAASGRRSFLTWRPRCACLATLAFTGEMPEGCRRMRIRSGILCARSLPSLWRPPIAVRPPNATGRMAPKKGKKAPKKVPVFDYSTGQNGRQVAEDANLCHCKLFKVDGLGGYEELSEFPVMGQHGLHGGVKVRHHDHCRIFYH